MAWKYDVINYPFLLYSNVMVFVVSYELCPDLATGGRGLTHCFQPCRMEAQEIFTCHKLNYNISTLFLPGQSPDLWLKTYGFIFLDLYKGMQIQIQRRIIRELYRSVIWGETCRHFMMHQVVPCSSTLKEIYQRTCYSQDIKRKINYILSVRYYCLTHTKGNLIKYFYTQIKPYENDVKFEGDFFCPRM